MNYNAGMGKHPPYVWDYDLDEDQFRDLLLGKVTIGPLDRRWAAVRLIEYGTYEELVREIGFRGIVENWAEWRPYVRSESRKRGLDFLVDWIPRRHPELL